MIAMLAFTRKQNIPLDTLLHEGGIGWTPLWTHRRDRSGRIGMGLDGWWGSFSLYMSPAPHFGGDAHQMHSPHVPIVVAPLMSTIDDPHVPGLFQVLPLLEGFGMLTIWPVRCR
jgi:hypothetical protein